VKISYLGHATFLLETGGTSILIDPYDAKVGYPMPEVAPTLVLISHEHGDHSHLGMAQGQPRVIRGLAGGQWRTVKETVDGVAISSVPTYHDGAQGKERGRNTVFILEAEGLRIVHLADLGHELDEASAGAIGRPDVLMIPVGGHYTIDAAQAHAVVAHLRPGVVIPMHYKTEVNPGSPIVTVDAFLAGAQRSKQAGHAVTVDKGRVPREPEVWVMSWR
jgi:L-ascorbate metabolism protein UlaG (beta-lactamase superfamily)